LAVEGEERGDQLTAREAVGREPARGGGTAERLTCTEKDGSGALGSFVISVATINPPPIKISLQVHN